MHARRSAFGDGGEVGDVGENVEDCDDGEGEKAVAAELFGGVLCVWLVGSREWEAGGWGYFDFVDDFEGVLVTGVGEHDFVEGID